MSRGVPTHRAAGWWPTEPRLVTRSRFRTGDQPRAVRMEAERCALRRFPSPRFLRVSLPPIPRLIALAPQLVVAEP